MRAPTMTVLEGWEVEALRGLGWRTLRRMGGYRIMVRVRG